MFKFIFLLLVSSSAFAEPWSHEDTVRESVYLTLLAVDWAQTRSFLRNGDEEANPFLGERPHQDKVDAVVILTGIAHVYVASILPESYRSAFQYVSIGVEVGAVSHNFSLGVRARF